MSAGVLDRELRMLIKRAAFLDAAAYLISTLFYGFTYPFALGLLLGTAVLAASLHLLRVSVERMAHDAKSAGVTSQRRYLVFYALRLLVFAAGFAVSLLFSAHISPIAVCIPMLYPRLIYTAGALFQKPGTSAGEKKR